MATLIVKISDMNRYLLDAGKLVVLTGAGTSERMAELHVDDSSWYNLIAAYGQPVYD